MKKIKHKAPPEGVKGWIVYDAEQVWFLPYSAVEQDYINFLMDNDRISEARARKRAESYCQGYWFYEQYIWEEVRRDGILLTPKVPQKYREYLDFWMDFCEESPGSNSETVGPWKEK